jgi:hypothetical protein
MLLFTVSTVYNWKNCIKKTAKRRLNLKNEAAKLEAVG